MDAKCSAVSSDFQHDHSFTIGVFISFCSKVNIDATQD